jgi:hypothetical protein
MPQTLVTPVASGCAVAAGAAYVAAVDPGRGGVFLRCPLHSTTGMWCPACGLTRAAHHLFRGDLVGALHFNLFVPLAVVAAAYLWAASLWQATGRPWRWPTRLGPRAGLATMILLVAFGVVRNLPPMASLRGG